MNKHLNLFSSTKYYTLTGRLAAHACLMTTVSQKYILKFCGQTNCISSPQTLENIFVMKQPRQLYYVAMESEECCRENYPIYAFVKVLHVKIYLASFVFMNVLAKMSCVTL